MQLIKRGDTWTYRFNIASVGGQRKSISKGGFRTKKEAETAGNRALTEYNNTGSAFRPDEISVADYYDVFMDTYVRLNMADATAEGYESTFRPFIGKYGSYRLRSISTLQMQRYINDLASERKLELSTIKTAFFRFNVFFKYAAKTCKYIAVNPMEDVIIPAAKHVEKNKLTSQAQLSLMLEYYKDRPRQTMLLLIGWYTGMRLGEICALTWQDIDLDMKRITVRHNVYRKQGTGFRIKSPKTQTSHRTIGISDSLVDALRAYRRYQERNMEEYGEYYIYYRLEPVETLLRCELYEPAECLPDDPNRIDFVITSAHGKYSGTTVGKVIGTEIRKAFGFDFHMHNLRSTHSTMLIEGNAPLKGVQDRLGHANVKTTLTSYVQTTDAMRDETAAVFERQSTVRIDFGASDETARRRKVE